ncbi:MAG: Ig-like domain-containing protein [Proteobacteria bacterium]|nr:Ig-like domain-containing protein [Pseudomonadota bacterium]
MEILVFNNQRDTLDLTTYFGDTTPPTVKITDNTTGTATGNVTYSLAFSEAVTGLTSSDFTITNGSVISVTGSGAAYSVVVAPTANTEGGLGLTLNAAAVIDAAGNPIATATSAAVHAIDTKAPTITSFSPATQATGVAINSNIVLTFSESIQRGSGNIALMTSSGTLVATYDAATSGNISISGNTLTVHPASDLGYHTGYALVVTPGSLKDLAGNAYAGTSSYGFTSITGLGITGTTGNDLLVGSPGNDTIVGGGGIDTVKYSGPASNFVISANPDGSYTVRDNTGAEGIDTLRNIDRVQFSDTKVALDLNGNAGTTAKVLGAVFGATSVSNKQFVGIGLSLLDAGMSYADLMQAALNAGGATTPPAVVDLLWTNLVGSHPTAANAAPIVDLLKSGALTVGALGVMAADLDLNTTHINLVGLQQTGLEYS